MSFSLNRITRFVFSLFPKAVLKAFVPLFGQSRLSMLPLWFGYCNDGDEKVPVLGTGTIKNYDNIVESSKKVQV
jgi:hypothetical protein